MTAYSDVSVHSVAEYTASPCSNVRHTFGTDGTDIHEPVTRFRRGKHVILSDYWVGRHAELATDPPARHASEFTPCVCSSMWMQLIESCLGESKQLENTVPLLSCTGTITPQLTAFEYSDDVQTCHTGQPIASQFCRM